MSNDLIKFKFGFRVRLASSRSFARWLPIIVIVILIAIIIIIIIIESFLVGGRDALSPMGTASRLSIMIHPFKVSEFMMTLALLLESDYDEMRHSDRSVFESVFSSSQWNPRSISSSWLSSWWSFYSPSVGAKLKERLGTADH